MSSRVLHRKSIYHLGPRYIQEHSSHKGVLKQLKPLQSNLPMSSEHFSPVYPGLQSQYLRKLLSRLTSLHSLVPGEEHGSDTQMSVLDEHLFDNKQRLQKLLIQNLITFV